MLLSLTMRWTILFQKQKPDQQKCKLTGIAIMPMEWN
jgi:hypothetical protein